MTKKKTTEKQVVTMEGTDVAEQESLKTDSVVLAIGGAAAAYGGYLLSRSYMRRFLFHPAAVFAAGAVAGAMAYKHRKSLTKGANDIMEAGSDFALEQKEKLSDLIAEAKQHEETDKKEK